MSNNSFELLPPCAQEFLYYYKNIKNASPKTVSEYYLDLKIFLRFIKLQSESYDFNQADQSIVVYEFNKCDPSDITIQQIENIKLINIYEFLSYCSDIRNDSVSARCRKISSIRSFFKFLFIQGYISNNPTEYLSLPKKQKSLPYFLTLDQSLKLLESIDGTNKVRNFAIITLFLNCGMRLSELCGLNLSDINGNSLRLKGKGNKIRYVYLNKACNKALDDYMIIRNKINDNIIDQNALFISRNNKRISNRMVQTLVTEFLKKAGIDTSVYSVHKLRHTAATLMYQNGTDVLTIKEILGHENLSTTQIYTHVASNQIEEALKNNPLSNVEINSDQSESEKK